MYTHMDYVRTYKRVHALESITLLYFTLLYITLHCGPESVGGIAIRYGLDGPGIEFRWERDFTHPVPGANPASCTVDTGSLSQG
jgi:hypothetical protein